jgi:hypothetical protein
MASHAVHHYVPVFLLKEWQSAPDHKLSCFQWVQGHLLHNRYKAKSVAKEEGLYKLEGVQPGLENTVERDFLGPDVDDPAAVAHQVILGRGVRALSVQGRVDWTRFLISLLLRTPDQVEMIRTRGRESLTAEFKKSPEEYTNVRGDDPAASLTEWVEQNNPAVFTNFGVELFPALVGSGMLNQALVQASWATRIFPSSCVSLLIGDNPLIYIGAMARSFLIALPIAAHRVFFAFNHPQTWRILQGRSDASVAKNVNRDTVGRAVQYVYGTDDGQRRFIERYLRKPAAVG